MRSLVVLLLVAAAATALFFAYQSLGEGQDPGHVGPETVTIDDTAPVDETVASVQDEPQKRAVEQVPLDTSRQLAADDDGVEGFANQLSGRVLDPDNQPVPNAKVTLTTKARSGEALATEWFLGADGPSEAGGDPNSQEFTTGADGRYVFKDIDPSPRYFLVAEHADFSFSQESYVTVGSEGDYVGPDIRMEAGSTVFGYVTDTNGNPIPGATIHVDSSYMLGEDLESPDRMTTSTDAAGYYEIQNVSEGPRNVSAMAEGQGTQIQHNVMFRGRPDDRQEKNFRLEVGHPIAGRVVGPNGQGIEDAKVLAMNYGNNTSSRGECMTDANGAFQIEHLRQGSYILMVSAHGWRPGRLNRVQVGEMDAVIDMVEQAKVDYCVVDSRTGQPVTSFEASARRVTPGGNAYETVGPVEKVQSATGCGTLRGIDPGQFVVMVEAPGYAPRFSDPFTVTQSAPVTGIQVALDAGGALHGRVVDGGGVPVAGARVSSHDPFYVEDNLVGVFGGLLASKATQRSTRTKSDGSFELNLLTPGEYLVRVSSPDHTREYVSNLTVAAGVASKIGDIVVHSGGSVVGTVYDRTGKALAGGYVHLRSDDPNSIYDTRADSSGQFEFRNVRPGSYRLSASGGSEASGDPFEVIVDQTNSEITISVSEGGTVNQNLNLGG